MTHKNHSLTAALGAIKRRRGTVMAAVALALVGGSVIAQQLPPPPAIEWTPRRLDQLDRNVRRLERAVTQRNAAGDPVLIETDPEVVALTGRVNGMDRRLNDVEASFQRMNGDIERLSFELDESQRDNAALRAVITDANNRIRQLEQASQLQAELNAPITADSPTGTATGDLAAAVRLANANDPRAARMLETVIVTWPDAPEARQANYRLGDLRATAGDDAGAVQAYAAALSGWPRAGWAGEATLRLASALTATDRKPQACAALAEFGRRYSETASAALKTRATQIRARAECE
jgi:TolA-binding protein